MPSMMEGQLFRWEGRKAAKDAGQCVGVTTRGREFSLGGSIFSLKFIGRRSLENKMGHHRTTSLIRMVIVEMGEKAS